MVYFVTVQRAAGTGRSEKSMVPAGHISQEKMGYKENNNESSNSG